MDMSRSPVDLTKTLRRVLKRVQEQRLAAMAVWLVFVIR